MDRPARPKQSKGTGPCSFGLPARGVAAVTTATRHRLSWRGSIAGIANLRTVPDVSTDADPNTGADAPMHATLETVGGTSLASPLALGVWDRIGSDHGEAVTSVNPNSRSSSAFMEELPARAKGHVSRRAPRSSQRGR